MRPIALTIAGSDSSGGAGIQADLKAFGAFGVYGASVITALTAQNTRGVDAVEVTPADFVERQVSSVLGDLDVRAVKTGMLARAETVLTVARCLSARPDMPVVVDPVMVSTSGHRLLDDEAVSAVRECLFPFAAVVTPNLAEAAVLTDRPIATDPTGMVAQGKALVAMGARAVLVKGGHAVDDGASGAVGEAADCLVTPADAKWFSQRWVDTPHTHGTGCTLSAAIAAGLALGWPLETAIARAKAFLTAALDAGRELGVGSGHGPPDLLVPAEIWRRWS